MSSAASPRSKRKCLRVSSTATPQSEREKTPELSKSEPARNKHLLEAMESLNTIQVEYTEEDACRTIIVALCTKTKSNSQAGSFTRCNTQKLSYSGTQVYERISSNLQTTEASLRFPFCLKVLNILVKRGYIVSDNKKKCALTDETVYHVKAEHLLDGITSKTKGLSLDEAIRMIAVSGEKREILSDDHSDSSVNERNGNMGSGSEDEGILSSSPIDVAQQNSLNNQNIVSAAQSRIPNKKLSQSMGGLSFLEAAKTPVSITTAGSIEDLVVYLTAENISDITFRDSFVLTHPTFVDPVELVHLLCKRWNVLPTEEENASATQLKIFTDTKQKPIRIKIMGFVKIWADHFPHLFLQGEFLEALNDLSALVKEGMGSKVYKQFTDSIVNSSNHSRVKKKALETLMEYPVSDGYDCVQFILENDPELIAQQITLVDHQTFCNITVSELLNKAWMRKESKHQQSPHICLLIERFNKAAQWVGSVVVQCVSLEQRVSLLSRMIAIAHAVKEYNNHFSGMALLAGINSTTVKRLNRTWDKLDAEDLQMLESIRELYATSDNYGNYRKLLKKTTTTCTPYIGLYLRDLVYMEDGNPNNVNGLINFKKRTMASKILLEIKRFQSRPYSFAVNETVVSKVVDYFLISDTESYQQSLRIEPKDPYTVIEELLEEEKQTETQLTELKRKLLATKAKHAELKQRNILLQRKLANNGADTPCSFGWKRFTPQPRTQGRPQRTLLLTRTKSLQS